MGGPAGQMAGMMEDLKHRALGLALLALATVALAIWVVLPMQQAEQGAAFVEVHPFVTVGCGPIITLGLALLVCGKFVPLRDPISKRLTRVGLVLALLGFAGGGALFWWLNQQLTLLGY